MADTRFELGYKIVVRALGEFGSDGTRMSPDTRLVEIVPKYRQIASRRALVDALAGYAGVTVPGWKPSAQLELASTIAEVVTQLVRNIPPSTWACPRLDEFDDKPGICSEHHIPYVPV